MRLPILASGLLMVAFPVTEAAAEPWELAAQKELCADIEQEVPVEFRGLPGRPAAADCESEEHAIEIDSMDHYKQAIGQALYYASQLRKRAGLILVCRRTPKLCLDDWYRVEAALSYSKVNATVWFCLETDKHRNDCLRKEFGETPSSQ